MDGGLKSVLSSFGINFENEYPVLSNKYIAIIGGNIFGFSKISGLNLYSANVKGVNYGGADEPFMIYEPNSSLNTLKLEKGFGTVDILGLVEKVSMLILIIKGSDNSVKGVYYTNKMMVKSVTLSDLDAGKSDVLIQTMEICYTSFKTSKQLNSVLTPLLGLLDGSDISSQGGTAAVQAVAGEAFEEKEKADSEVNKSKDSENKGGKGNENINEEERAEKKGDGEELSSYERQQQQIQADTERLHRLKLQGIKNAELRRAKQQNETVENENKIKEEELKAEKEKEIEDKLKVIEL